MPHLHSNSPTPQTLIVIDPAGDIILIDSPGLRIEIFVETTVIYQNSQGWFVDLTVLSGPILGPYPASSMPISSTFFQSIRKN